MICEQRDGSRWYLIAGLTMAIVNATTGCNRPSPVVICHNSNCTGALDPDRDDTLAALEQSLALGPAVLDGVEVDAVWQAGACHFAHEAGHRDAPLLAEPLHLIVEYLQQQGSPHSGAAFTLLLELKSSSEADADLGKCAVQALDIFRPLAATMPIEVLVSSFDQKVLGSLALAHEDDLLHPKVGAELGTTTKLSTINRHLDFVSTTPDALLSPAFASYRDQGFEVALWNEQVTPQFLDAVQFHTPQYVSVGEAAMMRGWIGR